MRKFISLVENGFDWHREAIYSDKISRLLADAQTLQREIADLNVAPSIQAKLDFSMATVVDYLDNLMDHISKNLNPAPRRRR